MDRHRSMDMYDQEARDGGDELKLAQGEKKFEFLQLWERCYTTLSIWKDFLWLKCRELGFKRYRTTLQQRTSCAVIRKRTSCPKVL